MREQTERLLWWLVLVIAVAFLAAMCAQRLVADELDNLSDRQIQLHAENQRHRVAAGLAPQQLDAELCGVAQRWANHMAARGWMGHGGGEQCVAYGTSSAPATIAMWLGSAPHRAWLMSRTDRAGWGAAQSSGGTWFWAAAFRGQEIKGGGAYTPVAPRRWRLFRR